VKLVDTSSWVHALRHNGDAEVRQRVHHLLRTGTAAWCDMVRVELWHGVRGVAERKMVEALEADVILLPTTEAVWDKARELARRSRAQGLTVPAGDLIVAACAWEHGVEMEHHDAHLTALAVLGD
jgi:predicted nucleic acid-binding protein